MAGLVKGGIAAETALPFATWSVAPGALQRLSARPHRPTPMTTRRLRWRPDDDEFDVTGRLSP